MRLACAAFVLLASFVSKMSAASLYAPAYRELPTGSIRSAGWMDDQLQLSIGALAGQQQHFYGFIKDGTFTGGKTTYSPLNEAQPYYLQAAAAAVFTTDAPDLRTWVDSTFDYIIDHQDADGWFGPEPRILWPRWPILNAAVHYVEGAPEKADKVLDFMYRFVNVTHTMLTTGKPGTGGLDDPGTNGLEEWGSVRTAEYAFVLQWLYDNHPRDAATQAILLSDQKLIRTLGAKKIGDFGSGGWTAFYEDANFSKDGNGPQNIRSHGVNVAMSLKEAALHWRLTGSESDKTETRHNWDTVYRYHGKPAGHFNADEHLAGFSPDRGSETCLVVEAMWSASLTYAVFGAGQDADRAERLAFNSLPAAMTGDWWGRQYLQQEMQLSAQPFTTNPFASDGGESNVFGLQTNYPCCTVNHPQGLPRFVSRAYVRRPASSALEGEMLLHTYLIPSVVKTDLNGTNTVTVEAKTNYPFEDVLRYSFNAAKPFQFGVRVPGWSSQQSVATGGAAAQAVAPDANGIITISVPAGQSDATVTLNSQLIISPTPGSNNTSVSVSKGALLYALPLAYTLDELRQDPIEAKAIDYKRVPKDSTSWKMAIDPSTAKFVSAPGTTDGAALSSPVFDDGKAPVSVQVQGCAVPDGWNPVDDGAWNRGFPPAKATCVGTSSTLTLQPYGAAKLHVGTLAVTGTASGKGQGEYVGATHDAAQVPFGTHAS